MTDYVVKRGGRYVYKRRVPSEYKEFEKREYVEIGLRTHDLATAARRAESANAATEEYWENLSKHNSDDARLRYEAAVRTARFLKLEYKTADELLGGSVAEILHRLKVTEGKEADHLTVTAALGLQERPEIMVSQIPELYFDHVAVELSAKSPNQLPASCPQWSHMRNTER